MENFNINDLVRNILNKANSIVDCLPYHLQNNINELINCVRNFSLEHGIIYEYNCFFYHGKLSWENLYMTLNVISKDLGICLLLFPKNVNLEDAAHNIGIIINYIINCNSVLDYNYNVNKRRKI